MNAMLIERKCADCLLRALASNQAEPSAQAPRQDAENAQERQLEQLEHSFGPNWKW